jgi:hypothetical protein
MERGCSFAFQVFPILAEEIASAAGEGEAKRCARRKNRAEAVRALEELEVGRGLLGGEKKSLAFHAKDFSN